MGSQMPEKPRQASDYGGPQADLVRQTCLYFATRFGDFLDQMVVVGGLVPSLLIDQNRVPAGQAVHAGTLDLDVGLSLGLLNEERYRAVTGRLRESEFTPDVNPQGSRTRQRWRAPGDAGVTVDFLIPQTDDNVRGGTLQNIEGDFAAVVTPGLELAFSDIEHVQVTGTTILGESVTRTIPVCGPGAYVVLKALAFSVRGTRKDAYDLDYVLRSYGNGIEDVALRLVRLLPSPHVESALETLRNDFTSHDALGPLAVARFVAGDADDDIQADVVGSTLALLAAMDGRG